MLRLLILLATLAIGSAQAQAGTAVQCTGTVDVTFSPPLTNTPQSTLITVSEVHNPCLHIPVGGLPFLLSASSSAQVSRVISCTTLQSGGPGTSLVQWANGDTSTINWTATVNYISGNIVVLRSGTVASGRYAGETTAETLIESPVLAGNLDFLAACNTAEGVPRTRGTYTSTYTP